MAVPDGRRSLRRFVALVVTSGILVLVGGVGALLSVATDSYAPTDPALLQIHPDRAGAYVVAVHASGRYAIWAATGPVKRPGVGGCTVSAGGGGAVPVQAAPFAVQWVDVSEDDAVLTWIATFDARSVGSYRMACRTDDPGKSLYAARAPNTVDVTLALVASHRLADVLVLAAGLVMLAAAVSIRACAPSSHQRTSGSGH